MNYQKYITKSEIRRSQLSLNLIFLEFVSNFWKFV